MKLKIKLLLIIIFVFLTLFASTEYIRYRSIKNEVVNNLLREAKNIRSVLMATRRVYHRQFLESGIPLTDKTIGFLPAHSLSRISEDFKNWTESELYFNNVSDRPRNPRNRADPLEMKAINYFRENSTEKERFISFKSEKDELFYHYSAPIWVEKYCMKCHGKREDADITIRTQYVTAFNYKVGELRGLMSIKLPATQSKALVWANFQRDLWVHLAYFTGMFFLVSWLLRYYVTNPVNKLTVGLEEVAGGNFEYPIEELSGEMSIVGKAFNRMSEQLGQRENELRESEERYRDLFENANDLIQSITPDGQFVYVNRSWRETLGYTEEEVLKLTLFDIIHPDSHSHYMETFVNVISGEKVERVETVFVSKSGKNIIVDGSVNCCFKEGKPVSTRGIFRNITERKRAEEAILKRGRLAVLGADIGVVLTKPNTLRVMLEGCVEAFVKHLDVAFARIWTLNQEKDMLELQASAGLYTHIDGSHSCVPVGSFKIGQIAQEHKPHLTNDVINDPRISDKDWARQEGMVAFAGYPLIVEDRLVGVMAMFACQPLTKEIFDALGSVADSIALGIEHKRAEVQIRMLSRVVEQSPNIVVITDTKGSIEYVNPKFTRSTGYSSEEAIGQNPRILKTYETPQETYEQLWKAITSGQEWRGEFCNKKKNGEPFWESAYILPIKNDEGDIIHFVAIKEDITVQRQASHELKRVNEQLQISIDQMPTGYILFDKEFRVLEWNQAAERIFGYSKSEVLGKYVANLIVPEKVGQQVEEVIKTLQKGEVSSYSEENNNISKDGKLISCQWYNAPLKDRNGQTFGILSMVEDVTESKQAENLLRKSEEKYRRLIENLRDNYFFYVHDTEGIFTYISPSVTNVLGYSAEEFLTHYSEYLTDNPINKEVVEHTELSSKGIKQPLYEVEIYHKDGSIRSLQVQETPIFNENRMVIAVEGIAQDVTERRKMEKEIIKAQKLESVGVLAGGIAHDFNNSLQAILGYITMAKMHASSNNGIQEYLNEANKAIFHSRDLTQQLLTFSRGGDPVKSTIFISKLIRDSAKLALSGSNLRCDYDIPDDLWLMEADKGQLNQVISNLIINADQAMPEGGIIRVKAENINVVERDLLPLQEGRYVKITIEDHGTGISQEHLQKIFDPYYTTKQNGNGLGLSITYSIIKKHDGHITVESEIGVGTTFHIYLPASKKEIQNKLAPSEAKRACPAPVQEKDEEKPNVSKGKVLLMDDEYIIRTILSKQLRGLKYEVEAVEDGSEAIRLYKSASRTGKPFDVAIIDLTITCGMGGKEAIKRLLEIDPEVRAIVVSGYANDPIMANYKKYGFSGVLPKPHEIHELDETLQKVIAEAN